MIRVSKVFTFAINECHFASHKFTTVSRGFFECAQPASYSKVCVHAQFLTCQPLSCATFSTPNFGVLKVAHRNCL